MGSKWIAHLYMEDVIVAECSFDSMTPMLRTAHRWRVAVKSNPNALVLVDDVHCEDYRLQSERKTAIPRVSRRPSRQAPEGSE
jgi:hypothetical protein